MTQEEKARAYDAALEKARMYRAPDWMPKFLDELRAMKNYFDWDEHRDIEEHILAIINWNAPDYFDRKEKEQKPEEEPNDFEITLHDCMLAAQQYLPGKTGWDVVKMWAEELSNYCPQPKDEWSEEEYGRLFDIEHYLDGTLQLSPDRKIACIDFLKSLRPSWKPSEAQMRALNEIICLGEISYVGQEEELIALKNKLKKLM